MQVHLLIPCHAAPLSGPNGVGVNNSRYEVFRGLYPALRGVDETVS